MSCCETRIDETVVPLDSITELKSEVGETHRPECRLAIDLERGGEIRIDALTVGKYVAQDQVLKLEEVGNLEVDRVLKHVARSLHPG